jgi:hypothetical protein
VSKRISKYRIKQIEYGSMTYPVFLPFDLKLGWIKPDDSLVEAANPVVCGNTRITPGPLSDVLYREGVIQPHVGEPA